MGITEKTEWNRDREDDDDFQSAAGTGTFPEPPLHDAARAAMIAATRQRGTAMWFRS